MSEKKAYTAICFDQSAVVFAKNGAEARRFGASELDTDFESIESCFRSKQFDDYAEQGYVPLDVLIDWGWWFECGHCSGIVTADCEERVINGGFAYCNPQCLGVEQRERRLIKRFDDLGGKRLRAMAAKKFPDVKVVSTHIFARTSELRIEQAFVELTFPGGSNISTQWKVRDRNNPRFKGPHALVPRQDLDAWNAFLEGIKASKGVSA